MLTTLKLQSMWNKKFGHFELVWPNIIGVTLVHIAALYGIYLKFFNIYFYTRVFAVFYTFIGGLGVTAAKHRYFSHRAFEGNRLCDILLMILSCITFEQSIYTWSRDHRLHHKYSETDADPYNSKRGFFFCHMGWFFVRKHKDVKEKGKSIDMSDLKANPIVMFEYKYCVYLAIIFNVLVPTLIPWYFWNEQLKVTFFYSAMYRFILSLHFTWSVNSFAHMYGMKPYDKAIKPAENLYVATMALGEGYHNYHHTFPWDYKAAELGTSFRNPTTNFIDFLARIGLVTNRKSVSTELLNSRIERTGDKTDTNNDSLVKSWLCFIVMMFVLV